ncbi:uncharacterized protein [Typha angustifolia]|uniref:uncharacterized protein n=1 Tax=Typha angustifolia TaxID=59011 RepID=UPI003C2B156D
MAEKRAEEKGVEEEGMTVLDFDMLCATVALQAVEKRGKMSIEEEEEEEKGEGEYGGVQRMWEGDVLDCFEDRRIAIEAACCPCYRFGKNMRRANLGSCFLQGTVYFMLIVLVLLSLVTFGITEQHIFLYTGVGSAFLVGAYLGYFRTRVRKQFNIRGSDSSLDDCVMYLICPCCTLSQESRTLEMNNVQCGVWHGRGDTICLGSGSGREGNMAFSVLHKPYVLPVISPDLCSMERSSISTSEHSWNTDASHSDPLVPSAQCGRES